MNRTFLHPHGALNKTSTFYIKDSNSKSILTRMADEPRRCTHLTPTK
jgi:hypothetical protein